MTTGLENKYVVGPDTNVPQHGLDGDNWFLLGGPPLLDQYLHHPHTRQESSCFSAKSKKGVLKCFLFVCLLVFPLCPSNEKDQGKESVKHKPCSCKIHFTGTTKFYRKTTLPSNDWYVESYRVLLLTVWVLCCLMTPGLSKDIQCHVVLLRRLTRQTSHEQHSSTLL